MQDVLFLYDVGVVLVFVFIVVVGDLCHISVEKKKSHLKMSLGALGNCDVNLMRVPAHFGNYF